LRNQVAVEAVPVKQPVVAGRFEKVADKAAQRLSGPDDDRVGREFPLLGQILPFDLARPMPLVGAGRRLDEFNRDPKERPALEKQYGRVWDTRS